VSSQAARGEARACARAPRVCRTTSPRAASCSTRSSATSARWTTWCPSSTPRPPPFRQPLAARLLIVPASTMQHASWCQFAHTGGRAAGCSRLCMSACQAWTSSMPAASAVLGRSGGVHGSLVGVALRMGTCQQLRLQARVIHVCGNSCQLRTRPASVRTMGEAACARVAGLRLGLAGLQQGQRQAGAGDNRQPGPTVHQGEG